MSESKIGIKQRLGALPESPEALEAKQSELSERNYLWLYLAVWLGLRPEEIENLRTNRESWRVEKNANGVTRKPWVFQTKLVSVDKKDAWKPIPLIHPKQHECLGIIAFKKFKRPLNKVLRKTFPASRITSHSDRKGFTDLMLSGEAIKFRFRFTPAVRAVDH